jgi:neprosin-like protein
VPSWRPALLLAPRRVRRWTATLMTAALVVALNALIGGVAAAAEDPFPGCVLLASGDIPPRPENHCYQAAHQDFFPPQYLAHGVGAYLYEAIPPAFSSGYSLAQITLENDSVPVAGALSANDDAIEFGWLENPAIYGDSAPHLFLTVRKAAPLGTMLCVIDTAVAPPCANGMWYPDPAAHVHLGDQVGVSGESLYHVAFYAPDHSWWVQYGSEWIGRISNDWWNDGFSDGNHLDWQGEVAFYPGDSACVPMGNGAYGTDPAAAFIHGMFYDYDDQNGTSLSREATAQLDPGTAPYWTMGPPVTGGGGVTGFSYGGPGQCP